MKLLDFMKNNYENNVSVRNTSYNMCTTNLNKTLCENKIIHLFTFGYHFYLAFYLAKVYLRKLFRTLRYIVT